MHNIFELLCISLLTYELVYDIFKLVMIMEPMKVKELPIDYKIDKELLKLLSEANVKYGEYKSYLKNIEFDSKFFLDSILLSESLKSTQIEGAQISQDEMYYLKYMPKTDETKEIQNLKSAMKIANKKDITIVRESGEMIGKMLHETGVSMDYAPVLDIKRFEEKHAIGDRCYGETEEIVSTYGIEVMREIQKQGVISVVKHFPGHGSTKKDSHFQIPKITEGIQKIEEEDMIPFEKGIRSNEICSEVMLQKCLICLVIVKI